MMELKKLTVHNYKSLVNFELNEPNAFTVFAGPNGAGKSNIFEVVEYLSISFKLGQKDTEKILGGRNQIRNFSTGDYRYSIDLNILSHRLINKFFGPDKEFSSTGVGDVESMETWEDGFFISKDFLDYSQRSNHLNDTNYKQIIFLQKKYLKNFTRLFIKKSELNRIKYTSNERLLPDASNLESVLKRLLKDESIKEEFLEWLDLLIPGFSNIEIHSDNIGGTDTLLIYEEGITKPFTRNLISDGTYNILALLTAVYQTNEPQFLCIEEPENGLHPYVIETLVDFFRKQCEENGHVIWLNTHSPTLIKALKPEELVLVEKKNGETVIKQFSKDHKLYSLQMDEAWLSNALGGGLPW